MDYIFNICTYHYLFNISFEHVRCPHLGDIYAKRLDVNVSQEYFSLFIIVSILTAVSTALVGPVTFLGFLGANLSYRLFSTYKHTAIFFGGTLLTTILLIGSQF